MPELHKKSFNTASGEVSNSQMLLFVWGGYNVVKDYATLIYEQHEKQKSSSGVTT